MKKTLKTGVILLMIALAFVCLSGYLIAGPAQASTLEKVFYSKFDAPSQIYRSETDAGAFPGTTVLSSPPTGQIPAMVVDTANSKLYYADKAAGKIYAVSLNTSGVPTGSPVEWANTGVYDILAMSVNNGRLFYMVADASCHFVYLDSAGGTPVTILGDTTHKVMQSAVDPVNGNLYYFLWTSSGNHRMIYRTSATSPNAGTATAVLPSGDTEADILSLKAYNNKVYFAFNNEVDPPGGPYVAYQYCLMRMDNDGSNLQQVCYATTGLFTAIAVAPQENQIYFYEDLDGGVNSIYKLALNVAASSTRQTSDLTAYTSALRISNLDIYSPTSSPPTVTTQAVTSISTTTATGNGNITDIGSGAVTQHGVCWNTGGTPTTSDSKTTDGAAGTGAFTSSITGLTPGTLYHVRAYATNGDGTAYGSEVTFTALKLPTVTTQAVSSISTTTATGNGNVTDLGVHSPTQHGVCWNTGGTPTTGDSKTSDGAVGSTGAFTSSITGLTPGTLYHVRAYATNDAGTVYGSDVTFTAYIAPTVTTQAVDTIATTTATGNGNITSLGVPTPTQYGVCWNTGGTPTTADGKTTQGVPGGTGAFTSSITGLTPGTLYHVRAYVTNAAGTVYGNEVTFTALKVPTVTTQAVDTITTTTASGHGNVTDLGVHNPTQHGVCWGTTLNPTTSDSLTADGAVGSTGAFTSSITGLTPGTLYHLRAYATNDAGTVYGADVTFTAYIAPTVTTQAVDTIATTTASGHGNITSLGVPTPTQYGVCWNTGGTPTTADGKTSQGVPGGTGAFTSSITGLTPGTTYYVRAYATNTVDTVYGGEVSFTTLKLPTVTTQAVDTITTTTAAGHGNVTDLGIHNPSQHGVCWGTSLNPTTANSLTTDGAVGSTGAFISSITGLTPGTLYHVRAYATNDAGTVYGADVTFTAYIAPTVTTQAVSSIGTTTATGNGNLTVLGTPSPTQHGVCWGTALNPTTSDGLTTDGVLGATGAFTSSITGLTPGTLYHVRAYATNAVDTVYGADVTFTAYIDPTVTTQAVDTITTTTASGHGNITSLGVPTPTQYGVCWNTGGTPTTADSKTSQGVPVGTGAFTSSITGLTPGTTYYVRAYGTNAADTVYGGEVSFTALNLPTVTTQAADTITTTTASGHGNITNLGVPAATQYGVCWNTGGTPTTADSKTAEGAPGGTGAFTSSITGLTPGVTYYVRAYATNSVGTSYGGQVSFTTLAPEINVKQGATSYVSGAAGYDYSSQKVGTSTSITFTIENTGDADLNISSLVLGGANSGQFNIEATSASTIGVGSFSTFIISYNPTTAGVKHAAITISSDADNTPSFVLNLTGTGTVPEIQLEGNSTIIVSGDITPSTADDTDFGHINIAAGAITKTFTIRNIGTATLVLTDPAHNYVTISSANFTLASAPSSSIAAGAATTFQISYDPSVVGLSTATISIANDDTDENPTTFVIQGLGTTAPVITNLAGNTVTFIEGGTPVFVDSGTAAVVTDDDSSGYTGGWIHFDFTGSTANDYLGIDGTHVKSGGDGVIAAGETISVDGTDIGTVVALNDGLSGRNLRINLTAGATDALLSVLVQNITFHNTSEDPATPRPVVVSLRDIYDTSATYTVSVTVTGVNDPPTLTATGQSPTFVEGGSAVDLYSAVTAGTVEAGQTILQLVFTVANVNNRAAEILLIDGSDVALTDGFTVISTATNGMIATVGITGTTATVTVSKALGISPAAMQTLIDAMTYRNTSDNPLGTNRVITITSIQDNGGTANGGVDTTSSLALVSAVTITPVNDAPVVTNLNGDTVGVVAGGSAGLVDQGTNSAVTDVDSTDFNGGYLSIVQNTGNTNGGFGVDGTTITSGTDGIITAGENIYLGAVNLGTVDGANDGQGAHSLVIHLSSDATPARVTTLIRNITYAAPSVLGARTFTLTIQDGDGTANGGADTSTNAGFSINVTPNPPVIANLNGDTFTYDPITGGLMRIDVGTNAVVTDADSANFNGGNLTVVISDNLTPAEDVLGISENATVVLSSGTSVASTVTISGITIGAVSDNGTSGNNLVINLNASATPPRVSLLLKALAYANKNSTTPSLATRTVHITITDAGSSAATSLVSSVTVIIGWPEIELHQGATVIASGGNYDYGSKTVNTDTDIVFTVYNLGGAGLSLTSPLVINGPNADQFSLQAQPAANVTAGSNTAFTLRFHPTVSAAATANITITNNDRDEFAYVLVFHGTGIAAGGGGGGGGAPPPSNDNGNNDRTIAEVDTTVTPTAVDNNGNSLQTTGNFITVSGNQETLTVHIPVALGDGDTLGSFTDSAGITYANNTLTIPASSVAGDGKSLLKITGGNQDLNANIIIQTGDAIGNGNSASAEVKSITTSAGYTTQDLTAENPSVGEVASTISLDLAALPDNAEVKITTSLTPDPKADSAFQLAATGAGLGTMSVAYTINIEKTNIQNGTDINSATITMVVGPDWVAANGGTDAVRIIRYDPETGKQQVLETRFTGYDSQGRAIFEGFSPNGLSVFGLAGFIQLKPPSTPTPTPVITATPTPAVTTPATPTLPVTLGPLTNTTTETATIKEPSSAIRWWIWVVIAAVVVILIVVLIARRRHD